MTLQEEERKLQQRSSTPRLFQLDALRGIAAVCVVFYHLRLAFDVSDLPIWLEPFLSGQQAVILFFVLSGFVLSIPYLEGKRRPYGPYLVRRFWRIYMPFAAAVAVSATGAVIFRNHHLPLTAWYYATWQTPVTGRLLGEQLLMVPINSINTAFWSLSIEVQLSIVMPFLAIAARKTPAVACVPLTFLLFIDRWKHLRWAPFLGPGIPVVHFAPLFVLGAVLAKYRVPLGRLLRAMGPASWVVLGVSFLFYCDFRALWTRFRVMEYHAVLITGVGAAGIILCALSLKPFADLLEHRLPEYLGRISYSLYLMHSVALFAILDLLYGHLPTSLVILIFFLSAFGLAHLFCVFVEEPCMRLGKRFSSPGPRASHRT